MARKASVGIQSLIERTSGAKVEAKVIVDQVYAEMQHEALEFRHPRGGQAKYLEGPMFENYSKWMQQYASRFLRRGSDAVRDWFNGPGSALHGVVAKHAPIEFGDLKRSAGLVVKVGSAVKFTKPAEQPRLNDWELEGKDHMRLSGLGYRP